MTKKEQRDLYAEKAKYLAAKYPRDYHNRREYRQVVDERDRLQAEIDAEKSGKTDKIKIFV